MLKRVLVANRGEIAARILRTCREMNIETVAVYSEADKGALFTNLAAHSVCIGPARAQESYLNQDAILSVACALSCDGIHPGFGFLSENPTFAKRVIDCGITFIGPSPQAIALLGDKEKARTLMAKNGIPVVPGSDGFVRSAKQAVKTVEELGCGYPVLLKAAAGGGGKGMRRVDEACQMPAAFAQASAEATSCFADDRLYLEKLIANPRHIEVQILGDNFGKIVHLGERDCSMQRNHQKILEEAPAPGISPELRECLCDYAIRAAAAVNYSNAGTVEFIVDALGNCYFIEMNTRIQVEHPVSEMVTGINIVREQLRIAAGLSLPYCQDQIEIRGHAMECRINAEDPEYDFRPCPGRVDYLHLPSGFGVRVDTVLHPQYEVSPYYDSMIAKIIVHSRTRNEAICRMRRALEETIITGIKTNISLHYMLMYNPEFLANNHDTNFLERNLTNLLQPLGIEMAL